MIPRDKRPIAIIATLDTKGPEAGFLKSRIEAMGHPTLILDTGVFERRDPGTPVPDFSADDVAGAAGENRETLAAGRSERGTRDRAIRAMANGSSRILKRLEAEGRIDGVIGLGGAQGTEICTAAMRGLPLGVPKVMVSTVASGRTPFGIYTGTRDITIMHSVADILGLNSLTRRILANAAGAVVGMAEASLPEGPGPHLKVGMTLYGQTTPAGLAIKALLEERGIEVFAFHSNGTGGRAMEELAVEGFLDALMDLSTHELTDELLGGIHAGDAQRLLAAGEAGIPRLVVPGGLDVITLAEPHTVPEPLRDQPSVPHNPHITLVRANGQQMTCVATVMAERLNRARGPVAVVIPMGGWSFYNREGLVFYDPEANRAFVERLKAGLRSETRVYEVDAHVNDPEFARETVLLFDRLTGWRLENASTSKGEVRDGGRT